MKMLKQRIAKAFGEGTSKERGASNLEIVVWISVVLVIAVGLFLLRDNIAKFINNAATQIAGEESRPEGMNEYGFYFDKKYVADGGSGLIYYMTFYEDGSYRTEVSLDGTLVSDQTGTGLTYSDGMYFQDGVSFEFQNDGKTCNIWNVTYELQE